MKMGNVFNALSNLSNNIFGPSKVGVTGAPSSFPPARTPIELAGDQGPLESLNRDPFSSRFLSYPSNLINDVSVGQFDIRVIGNSTMPSNKWAEWEIYMQAYQSGLIDKVEALKKTDIFDKEGVLSRADQIQQLQQALAGAQNQIKKVSGDLQTAHREAIQARKRTEVEKFKTELNRDAATSKAESKLTMDRLKDAVKLESEKLRIGSQAQLRQEKSQKEKK